MNPMIFISNVPWWVVVVLALLVWRGWQALRSRTVSFRTIFIGPAIFIGWGVASLVTRVPAAHVLAIVWFVLALAGALLAFVTVPVVVQADRVQGTIRLPGSWWPMVRYLGIFATKFVLAAWSAMQPAMRSELAFWDVGVSGMSAGYFVCWLVGVLRAYRRAPTVAADQPVSSRP